MDHLCERLRRLADEQNGVFSRAQALALGHSSKEVDWLVRRRAWTRVRHGVYAETDLWQNLDPEAQHLAKVRGVLLRCGADLVVSHLSAVILHGWPTWNVNLDNVWVTRKSLSQRSRAEAGVHHLIAELPAEDVIWIAGVPVTSPERTMVDFARMTGYESAVVSCDAALRSGANPQVVRQIFDRQAQWPGARGAIRALAFADARAESVGESRTRVLCYQEGLPTPRLQADLLGKGNRYLGRGDFLFEKEQTLVEFDGKMKYAAATLDSSGVADEDPAELLFKEKRREDAIREEAGLEVVRLVWSDLATPARTAARIRAGFARAALRRPAEKDAKAS
nr:type IV toxin-antitoxin system AbiEi family antitoxin domain-containing protein [Actinopolymorpha alba]